MKPIKQFFLDLAWESTGALKSTLIPHSASSSIGQELEKMLDYQRKNFVSRASFNGLSMEIIDSFNVESIELVSIGRYRVIFDRPYANIGYSISGSSRLGLDALGFTIVMKTRGYAEIQMLSWPPEVYDAHELVDIVVIGEINGDSE